MSETHSLSNKDADALTADCSVCGAGVQMRKAGRGFACVAGRREARRRYREAHPARVAASKARRSSEHHLKNRDGSPDTCAVCGPVQPVVWGRGWMCPVRATERGWTNFKAEPTKRCAKCGTFLTVEGACPQCSDRSATDLGYAIKLAEYGVRPMSPRRIDLLDTEDREGWHVHEGEVLLTADMENVVGRWKTIGYQGSPQRGYASYSDEWDGKPKYIRPDYAKLYGSGNRTPARV